MHCVDLDESFQTHIYLQNLASIQPRASPVKIARSSRCRCRSSAGSSRRAGSRCPGTLQRLCTSDRAGDRTEATSKYDRWNSERGSWLRGAGGRCGLEGGRETLRWAGPRWLGRLEAAFSKNAFFENFANFWRARSRLYQNEILQENMRLTAFFKLYKMCTLLHRSKVNILSKHQFKNQQFC